MRYLYEEDSFPYEINRIAYYTPDFKLKKFYVEFKGYFKGTDRTKMIRIKKQHPDLDIRLVFQQNNWTTKNQTMRYSDWAEKYGFKWHVGISLPEEWIEELKK